MDEPVTEGVTFSNIRQTIRQVILPLVQAIYDENPEDIIVFCSNYFNNLLQKREKDIENMKHQMQNSDQKNGEDMNSVYQREKPKEIEKCPTNAQGSASAPLLTREKTNVNLRETSSWDTPSASIEPIQSFEVLKDVAYGIGDQPSSEENQIKALEEDEKAGDVDTSLKSDSAFEDDSLSGDKADDEVKSYPNSENHLKSPHCLKTNSDEAIKGLCSKFESLKTSDSSETLKYDNSTCNEFYQDISENKDIAICRKQLSPNSSFGFVPYLNEYDSPEGNRIKGSENTLEKTQTESNRRVTRKQLSETFQNIADDINSAETNFNAAFQNAKETSDVIQGRRNNENGIKFDNKSEKFEDNREDFIQEEKSVIPERNPDKIDLDNKNDETNMHCDKIPLTFNVTSRNIPGYFVPEEELKNEDKDVIEPMDSEQEKSPHKEKHETTFFKEKDDDNNDKFDNSESQDDIDKSWKKRWYEVHPSFENLNNFQRRDPRLQRADLPTRTPNVGAAGDVPNDRFYIPNGISNGYRNNHPRNQITSESSGRELNPSRFLSDDESHRCARPMDKSSSERKTSSEKMSNANPQNIPYSWRKLCKQSHSSENIVNYSKESQARLNEESQHSSNPAGEQSASSLNEMKSMPETDVDESEEMYFEAPGEITDKVSFGIKISNEENLSQSEDIGEKDISDNLTSDQNLKVHDAQMAASFKAGLYTDSKDKNISMEQLYNRNGALISEDVSEKEEKLQSYKKITTESVAEDQNGILLDEQKDKEVKGLDSHSMKGGLNAACGDFVSFIGDANEEVVASQTAYIDLAENNASERNNESSGGISREYFEEVIGRVMEQQQNNSMDSYEGLDFSSYSESDSSRMESDDFSEAEEFSMNESLQD